MADAYDNGLKKIADEYGKALQEHGEHFFEMMVMYKSIRMNLIALYQVLLKEKKFVRIEDLSLEEKTNPWKEAKRLTGMATTDKVVEVCLSIHALGTHVQ